MKLVLKRFVDEAVVAKKVVEVLLVVVELMPVKFWRVLDPVTRRLAVVMSPVLVRVPKVPMVEKRLVVVAWVPVAFTKVKFWKVEDAVARKLAAWMRAVEVSAPPFAVPYARVVAKRLVEVEVVVVEFDPVKFWRVDEPFTRRLAKVPRPEEVSAPPLAVP